MFSASLTSNFYKNNRTHTLVKSNRPVLITDKRHIFLPSKPLFKTISPIIRRESVYQTAINKIRSELPLVQKNIGGGCANAIGKKIHASPEVKDKAITMLNELHYLSEVKSKSIASILAVAAALAKNDKILILMPNQKLEDELFHLQPPSTIAYFHTEYNHICLRPNEATIDVLVHELTHAIDLEIDLHISYEEFVLSTLNKILPYELRNDEKEIQSLDQALQDDIALFKKREKGTEVMKAPYNNNFSFNRYSNIVENFQRLTNDYKPYQVANEIKAYYIDSIVSLLTKPNVPLNAIEYYLPHLTEWFARVFFPRCEKYLLNNPSHIKDHAHINDHGFFHKSKISQDLPTIREKPRSFRVGNK